MLETSDRNLEARRKVESPLTFKLPSTLAFLRGRFGVYYVIKVDLEPDGGYLPIMIRAAVLVERSFLVPS